MRVCPHVLCPRHHATWLGAALLTLAVLTHVCHAQGISIQPTTLTLSGPEGGRHVLVLHQDAKGRLGAPTEATVTSSNPWIAEVDARGWLKPVADGEVTLTAKLGDHEATATVKVVGMTQPQPWSFRNHVEPVLAKLSCNSGACHGAAPMLAAGWSACRRQKPASTASWSNSFRSSRYSAVGNVSP